MNPNIKQKIFSYFVLLILTLSMLYPSSVALADDTPPPPEETQEPTPPPEETEEPAPATEETEEPAPSPEETKDPVSSTEEPPAQDATPDPTGEVVVEGAGTEAPTEEVAPDPTDPPTEEIAPDQTGEEVAEEPESVTTILEQLPEGTNLVVLDQTGEEEPLATEEAAQTLAGGDPYFTRDGTIYRFLPVDGCAAYGGVSANCIESDNPIQAALEDVETNGTPDLILAPDGSLRQTIYVEAGTYAEQITINTADLTLWGDPGNFTSAGAGPNAPILDGSTWAPGSGDIGVIINAEGVTLIGFIIQNYDTAIFQPVVVGSNTNNILNNIIRDNGDGIRINKSSGSPGTEVHYNIFQNNLSYDLINNDPDGGNVQYINAQDNYWGCASGPVVAYKKYEKIKGQDVFVGWAYIDWATKHDYDIQDDGDDPDPNCAQLYGFDDLYNLGLPGNGEYRPYKIRIGTLVSPPPTEPTPTEPTPTEPTPTEPTPTEPTPTTPPPPTEPTPTEPTPTEPTPTEPTPTEPTPTEPTPTTPPPPTEPTPTQPTPTEPTPTEPTPTEPTPTQPTPTEPTPTEPTPPPPTEPTPIQPTPPPPTEAPTRPATVLGGFIPVTGGETHAIAAGVAHTCAITPEGGIQCWGNNDFGQLGDGSYKRSNIRVDVTGLLGATTIVAGGNHTCVLAGSEVWCWGLNSKGQVGDGTTANRNTPVKVLSEAMDLTAGFDYTCATLFNGQVMCWGNNSQGQLADGGQTNRTTPTLATLISGISNVDAGRNKTCGLTSTGLVRCLTSTTSQELGELPTTHLDIAVNRFGSKIVALINQGIPVEFLYNRPKLISQLSGILDVDSGQSHICAMQDSGAVYCWGFNYYGQLGNNSTTRSTDPVAVTNLSNAWQLAVGKYHACTITITNEPGDPGIECWGLNTDGQLGDGTNETSRIPVKVK